MPTCGSGPLSTVAVAVVHLYPLRYKHRVARARKEENPGNALHGLPTLAFGPHQKRGIFFSPAPPDYLYLGVSVPGWPTCTQPFVAHPSSLPALFLAPPNPSDVVDCSFPNRTESNRTDPKRNETNQPPARSLARSLAHSAAPARTTRCASGAAKSSCRSRRWRGSTACASSSGSSSRRSALHRQQCQAAVLRGEMQQQPPPAVGKEAPATAVAVAPAGDVVAGEGGG